MVKKTYEAKSVITISVMLSYSMKATVTFAPVAGGGSKFITTDTDLQQALEEHYQYGKLFSLGTVSSVTDAITEPKVQYYPRRVLKLETEVGDINGKIPAEASSDNQLADKQYVNDGIATATATFRGTFNLVNDLHLSVSATQSEIAAVLATVISEADNNDYSYVQIPTTDTAPTEIASIERYKNNGTAWAFEYNINTSGFTAAQWAAINSGITSGLVEKLIGLSDTSRRPFKSSWKTNTTLLEFCQDVAADEDALIGDVFLGGLSCTGLPTGMVNGEVTVEILSGAGNAKLLRLTLTSINLEPYHWEMSYFNDMLYGWRSFLPNQTLSTVATSGDYNDLINTPTIPIVPTNVSAFTNDAGYLNDASDFDPAGAAAAVVGTSMDNKEDDTVNGAKAFATDHVNTEALRANNLAVILSLAIDPNAGITASTTNPEWKVVYTDNNDRILVGKKQDNTWYFADDLDTILDVLISGYGL